MKNTFPTSGDFDRIGNSAYSRTKAYDSRFDYLDSNDRFYLVPPTPRYRLAIIGTGVMGQGHIRSTFVEGSATVAGLYDTHKGSIDAALKLCEQYGRSQRPTVYSSMNDAVSDTSIDGYIISTPNFTHAEVLEHVLQNGKPVFLEKPMATTVADAASIVRMVRGKGAAVQVGLQYRYKAIYREAIEETLNRGSIGDVKNIAIREHRIPFLDKVEQWNKFSELSGGTLVEKCCHYFDLFNLFSQSHPTRVFATGSQAASYGSFRFNDKTSDILDNAYVTVEYKNGVRAVFDLCMYVPLFFEELVLCGTGGRIRTFEQEDYLHSDGYTSGFEMHRGETYPARIAEPRYQGVIRSLGHSGADFFAQAAFIAMLDGDHSLSPTVEEGFWSVVVGAAAEASVKEGKPIDVNEFIRVHNAEI
ncbi:MAG: gfo/Idh/MocA family oxidoreductase [Spirochaetaceae bacterium]|nr:MAG: gfo/Idh/MocA family oxidoreductase [Spirochaetaceae bacterium]